jgi:hypothetical protein
MFFQDPAEAQEHDSTMVESTFSSGAEADLPLAFAFCVLVFLVLALLGDQERRSDAERSQRRMMKAKRAALLWQGKANR